MIARTVRVSMFSIYLAVALCAFGGETIQNTWSGVERIVAIGDIHGDYNQLTKALQLGGLVDQKNSWTGGKTHLVQTGDVFDRGSESRKCLDLLMALEKEAAAAGGMVHVLLGNHEGMRLGGQSRDKDLTPAEIESYGGQEEMQKAVSPEGKYGAWIRKHNAVIKINDTLFLHAGLSARYATTSLDDLDQRVRDGLKNAKTSGLARDSAGPMWYRGLSDPEKSDEATVVKEMETITKTYGVRRVVVGHTVTRNGVISTRGNGQLVMIDVGMVFGGKASCLVIERDKFFAVNEKGKTELPPPGAAENAAAAASSAKGPAKAAPHK